MPSLFYFPHCIQLRLFYYVEELDVLNILALKIRFIIIILFSLNVQNIVNVNIAELYIYIYIEVFMTC